MKNIKLSAIIIDDEPFVRDDLKDMLIKHPHIEVIGEAGDVAGAVRLISGVLPDVVFLDIQLRGGSGFDVIPHIPSETEVVFITAFDKYAVRAFEVNALDYLLKPVDEERLYKAVTRLLSRFGEKRGLVEAEDLRPFDLADQILIKNDRCMFFTGIDNITSVVSAGGNYSTVHLSEGKKVLVRRTMKRWVELLPSPPFVQIHRSFIVSANHVSRIERKADGSKYIYMSGHPEPFPVSRRFAAYLDSVFIEESS